MQYPLRREWSRGRGIAPGTRHTRQGAMTAAELFDLKGRVALITGASSGLGVRFAEVLAGGGASVALIARRADRLKSVQARIGNAGGGGHSARARAARRLPPAPRASQDRNSRLPRHTPRRQPTGL